MSDQKESVRDWYELYQAHAAAEWQPTQLSLEEEQAFQKWLTGTAWFREVTEDVAASGHSVSPTELLSDLIGPAADYDYRGAWKAGVSPERYEHDDRQHWPSSTPDGHMLKSPKHPTAWMEFFMRATGDDPSALGLRNAEEASAYTRNGGFSTY